MIGLREPAMGWLRLANMTAVTRISVLMRTPLLLAAPALTGGD
jgi:hypothetical protein